MSDLFDFEKVVLPKNYKEIYGDDLEVPEEYWSELEKRMAAREKEQDIARMVEETVLRILGQNEQGFFDRFEKAIVNKSWPLILSTAQKWPIRTLVVLDIYLARINPLDDSATKVIIKKGELESLLGVNRLRKEQLDKILEPLVSAVTIEDPDNSKERFAKIALFDCAAAEKQENGEWEIGLSVSEPGKKYFFNLENLGYIKYALKNTLRLESAYAYNLFLYIWRVHQKINTWNITLDGLKKNIQCPEEKYSSYKDFNKFILGPAFKEINEKTDLCVTFTPIKSSRTVVGLTITAFSNKNIEEEARDAVLENESIIEESALLEEVAPNKSDYEKAYEKFGLWVTCFEDANDWNMDFTMYEELSSHICLIPEDMMPCPPEFNSSNFKKYHYLNQKKAYVEKRAAMGNIKNKYNYLLSVIKKDEGLN